MLAARAAQAGRNALWVWTAVYLVSGVMQPLLIDSLHYMGGAQEATMLPLLANTLGMASVGLFVVPTKREAPLPAAQRFWATAIDMTSGALTSSGIVLVGSGTFTVIYSSTPAWTAVISFVLGHTVLDGGQWLGIAFVTLGLAMNGLGLLDAADDESSADSLGLGVLLSLGGTVLHAGAFVFNERVIKVTKVAPFELCAKIGAAETALLLLYTAFLLATNDADALYLAPVRAAGATVGAVVVGYGLLVFINAMHALAFFAMLGQLGAVSTGVLKAVLAVLIFTFAAVFFCENQASQCFSPFKAGSMLLVLFGSFVFVLATQQARQPSR